MPHCSLQQLPVATGSSSPYTGTFSGTECLSHSDDLPSGQNRSRAAWDATQVAGCLDLTFRQDTCPFIHACIHSSIHAFIHACMRAAGWARYVLTWQMHLTDSKVRPSGSPGRDSSLVDLMACPFPEHSSNCKFVGEPPETGSASGYPASCIIVIISRMT